MSGSPSATRIFFFSEEKHSTDRFSLGLFDAQLRAPTLLVVGMYMLLIAGN